jgi:hypothetical protein
MQVVASGAGGRSAKHAARPCPSLHWMYDVLNAARRQLEIHPWRTAIASLQVVVLPRYHLRKHYSSNVPWMPSSKQEYAAKVRSSGRGIGDVGEYWYDRPAHVRRFICGLRVPALLEAVSWSPFLTQEREAIGAYFLFAAQSNRYCQMYEAAPTACCACRARCCCARGCGGRSRLRAGSHHEFARRPMDARLMELLAKTYAFALRLSFERSRVCEVVIGRGGETAPPPELAPAAVAVRESRNSVWRM